MQSLALWCVMRLPIMLPQTDAFSTFFICHNQPSADDLSPFLKILEVRDSRDRTALCLQAMRPRDGRALQCALLWSQEAVPTCRTPDPRAAGLGRTSLTETRPRSPALGRVCLSHLLSMLPGTGRDCPQVSWEQAAEGRA